MKTKKLIKEYFESMLSKSKTNSIELYKKILKKSLKGKRTQAAD